MFSDRINIKNVDILIWKSRNWAKVAPWSLYVNMPIWSQFLPRTSLWTFISQKVLNIEQNGFGFEMEMTWN